ncbi:MAG: molecular chaperone TorD family protein [Candidatus Promineifilaceae bacterium]|nr:molecular chaperone TorD family protein [Candidatus Promineifilaceae bacterium]
MNPIESATARHHTYLLLSKFYLEPVTAELLPYIERMPPLAAFGHQPWDPDLAAAAHQRIFAHEILPFEAVFRDPSGLLGGPLAHRLQDLYSQVAYTCDHEPTHIGHELAFLALLCQGQARALAAANHKAVRSFEKLQTEVLRAHLLTWLPALAVALSHVQHPFYAQLGRFTLDLVAEHTATLEIQPPYSDGNNDQSPPDIWHDPQTNLKKIAAYITTPLYSGLYLSHDAISQLAREAQLPRGFGARCQILTNLLRSAAHYETVPDIFAHLGSLARRWQGAYQRQAQQFPHLAAYIEPWQRRAKATAESLTGMEQVAQHAI